MIRDRIDAVMDRRPFDLLIRNVRVVNVFNNTIEPGCIGIVDGCIVYVGNDPFTTQAKEVIDGGSAYALPGFIDSHMHLESSMLTPANFARVALSCGTTTVMADPHEICNVLGLRGVEALVGASQGLPLRVLMMASSTVPSAPGFESSGYAVGAEQIEAMLQLPGVYGLGEVMDFNGVVRGEEPITSVIEAASKHDCVLDGHISLLTGRKLQAFLATGIDSDHTTPTGAKLKEELALGCTVQVQECSLSEEMVQAMNSAPVQNRISLVTDDVPLNRLMNNGHLNHVVTKAISLGLDPMLAIRYTTINAADRMRLYHLGAIAPGRIADIQLVDDIRAPKPSLVITSGNITYRDGQVYGIPEEIKLSETLRHSIHVPGYPLKADDFVIRCDVPEGFTDGEALVNIIHQDGVSVRTKHTQATLPVRADGSGKGVVDYAGFLKIAIFNRYGKDQHGVALIDGMAPVFSGAVAITYGHDSHNLSVFGGNDADMALAANTVIKNHGGMCSVVNGEVRTEIELPLAGLISEDTPEHLLSLIEKLLADCAEMGLTHKNPLTFLTVMPLAVSPEIKCTDMGLINVATKEFMPLIESVSAKGACCHE